MNRLFVMASGLRSIGRRLSMVVSGEYANGAEALSALETEAEAADIPSPTLKCGDDGLELTRRALGLKPELKVIFISSYNDFDFVRERLGSASSIIS